MGIKCQNDFWAISSSAFDVGMTAGFGLLGTLFHKLGCGDAPLLLGFVHGPMMEQNFRPRR